MKAARTGSLASRWICRSCLAHLDSSSASIYQRIWGRKSSTTTHKNRYSLPSTPARTRFAPSPTGDLHLGSIRTALFNYLLAKATSGQFILRIEDTDQKRTIPGAEDRLFRDLEWAGLHWDEGPRRGGPYGPYRQSQRIALYQQEVESLLEHKTAYRCFCSTQRLDELNRLRHKKGLSLGYDRKCTHLKEDEVEDKASKGEPYVIRFRAPKAYPSYRDIVYGESGHGKNRTKQLLVDEPVYDDPVLIKSDGFPTYHFANVVDDKMMGITHVIRGSEWMSSTPLHVALYDALGWKPPQFGHVPLLVDSERQKLSKRNGNSDIASFRDAGIFPDTLVNFAALLGWSHQQKSDVHNLNELTSIFDLKFTKGNTIVSFDKLRFLQERHAQRLITTGGEPFEQLIRDVSVAVLEKYGAKAVQTFIRNRKLRDVIASMLQTKTLAYRSANDFASQLSIFFDPPKRPELNIKDPSILARLRVASALVCLTPAEHWNKDLHLENFKNIQLVDPSESSEHQISKDAEKQLRAQFYHYLRWALLSGQSGPSLPEILEILGKETSTERIQSAILASRDMETMAEKPNIAGDISARRFADRLARFEKS